MSGKSVNNEAGAIPTLTIMSKNIAYLMSVKGIDSTQVSKATGLGIATINSMRRGTGNPTLSTIITIAEFFGISLSELIEIEIQTKNANSTRTFSVPLISLKDVDLFFEKKLTTNELYTFSLERTLTKPMVAISVNNDSLYPHFSSGTTFILTLEDQPGDGDIVMIKIKTHTPCFRRIFIHDDDFWFTSITLTHDTTPCAYSSYRIMGVVVKIIKQFF